MNERQIVKKKEKERKWVTNVSHFADVSSTKQSANTKRTIIIRRHYSPVDLNSCARHDRAIILLTVTRVSFSGQASISGEFARKIGRIRISNCNNWTNSDYHCRQTGNIYVSSEWGKFRLCKFSKFSVRLVLSSCQEFR